MRLSWFGNLRKNNNEFEKLIESHIDIMYRVAFRYTQNQAQAEDLVHDTVVRALRFRHRFQLGTNFKAWILTILNRTFIHGYRRRQRERQWMQSVELANTNRTKALNDVAEQSLAEQSDYLRHMGQYSDEVLQALDSLPEEFRVVVVLCDIEELSYKEIAEVIDCPVGTVMSRLYRGRRLLESKLYNVAVERGIVKTTRSDADEIRKSQIVPFRIPKIYEQR